MGVCEGWCVMDIEKMMQEAMKKAMFLMENNLYNGLIAENAGEMDVDTYMQLQSIIAAFNKRGVSTKVVLDAFKEAFVKGGAADE